MLVGTTSADNFHGVGSGIHEAIAECGTAEWVRWTGFMPDETLRHLLTGTSALVLPSENEGFGLPAVEAAACGAPVVATTASPLPQLLEGGGYFVAPGDTAGLQSAMRALLDPRERAAPRRRRARARLSPHLARQCARNARRARRRPVDRAAPRPRARRLVTPLRFCMVTTFYPPRSFGGDAVAVQSLARALVRAGHEVTVICDDDAYRTLSRRGCTRPRRSRRRVVVHRLRSAFGAVSVALTQQTGRPVVHGRTLERLLDEGGFDVIHFHNLSLVGGPAALAYGNAVKLYTAHEHWLVCPTHVLWRHRSRAVHRARMPAMPAALSAGRRSCGVIRGCSSAISTR